MSEPFSAEAEAVIALLRAQVAQRDVVIAELLERVAALEARLGKNSKNSSQPPSSDNPFTKPSPRSLRGKSGRRPGKQPGAPGSRLVSRSDPDRVEVHVPACCAGCGADLGPAWLVGHEVRQVFDLPAVRIEVAEHRVQRRRCRCGQVTSGVFPTAASAPACYGPNLAALATYLMARHHTPVARTAELLADCFGARVSTGWLAGLLGATQARLVSGPGGGAGSSEAIREQLAAAPVAHFDETGARVAGKLWWVHVACTDRLTSYHRASGRGRDSADQGGVLPGFAANAGIGVHDGLTSYRGYEHMRHALCNAHHLRELVALTESLDQQTQSTQPHHWAQDMIDLLTQINAAVVNAKNNGQDRLPTEQLERFTGDYRRVIEAGHAAHPPPAPTGKQGRPKLGTAGSLLRRLDIYQHDVLRFATDFRVPFDNNQAERDIRMIRVQQKISGSWRSEAGADAYLAVRSYLSTARKQGHNTLDALREAFTGTPWLPAPT